MSVLESLLQFGKTFTHHLVHEYMCGQKFFLVTKITFDHAHFVNTIILETKIFLQKIKEQFKSHPRSCTGVDNKVKNRISYGVVVR